MDHRAVDDKDGPSKFESRTEPAAAPRSGLARWIVGILLMVHELVHVLGLLARPLGVRFGVPERSG